MTRNVDYKEETESSRQVDGSDDRAIYEMELTEEPPVIELTND